MMIRMHFAGFSDSEKDTSATFGGGYWFNQNFAVEGHIGTLYTEYLGDDVDLDLVSFGAGIFFVEALNKIDFFGFPLGFWFAQQGSIITFVILIAIYVWRMDKLDAEYGIDEYEQEVHHS